MKEKGYFGTLTSLKGLFILIIVLHNTLAVTPLFSGVPGTAFLILFGGSLGNSMFFLLSFIKYNPPENSMICWNIDFKI